MAKVKISKADMDALKEAGYVEGNPHTIPENISPVLKSQLLEEWRESQDEPVEAPTATEAQNQRVRDRVAAEEAGQKSNVKRQGEI